MSTAVNQHWNRHYRALKETTTMPLTLSLPEPATPDPLDPEVLALVQAANEKWLSRQAARDAHVAEARRALAEEPFTEQVEEPEAPSFTRLNAHGVSCDVAIVLVTPEIARRYLKNQARNRWQKKKHLQFLTGQMTTGQWKFNGEPLIFDENNQMLDGQHRCTSCIKSGQPFLTLAVRGIARSAYDRIDLSARRTSRDVLIIEDVPHAKSVAPSVARLLEFRRSGNWWEPRSDIIGDDIFRALPDFPGIEEHFVPARELARMLGGSMGMWVAARYLTLAKDEAAARDYWIKVTTGERLEPGDPELRLRQRLLDVRIGMGKVELTPKAYAGLIAAAWNYRRKGRKIQQLTGVRGDEPVPAFL